MKSQTRYIPGDRLVECDVCGFDYRFSEMRRGVAKGQQGLEVCPVCFDRPHPRDEKVILRKKNPIPQVK